MRITHDFYATHIIPIYILLVLPVYNCINMSINFLVSLNIGMLRCIKLTLPLNSCCSDEILAQVPGLVLKNYGMIIWHCYAKVSYA